MWVCGIGCLFKVVVVPGGVCDKSYFGSQMSETCKVFDFRLEAA